MKTENLPAILDEVERKVGIKPRGYEISLSEWFGGGPIKRFIRHLKVTQSVWGMANRDTERIWFNPYYLMFAPEQAIKRTAAHELYHLKAKNIEPIKSNIERLKALGKELNFIVLKALECRKKGEDIESLDKSFETKSSEFNLLLKNTYSIEEAYCRKEAEKLYPRTEKQTWLWKMVVIHPSSLVWSISIILIFLYLLTTPLILISYTNNPIGIAFIIWFMGFLPVAIFFNWVRSLTSPQDNALKIKTSLKEFIGSVKHNRYIV